MFLSSSTTRIDRLLMAVFLAGLSNRRQCKQECCALSGSTIHKYAASMHPDNVVHAGKTDRVGLRALRRFGCTIESAIEDFAERFRRNGCASRREFEDQFFVSALAK